MASRCILPTPFPKAARVGQTFRYGSPPLIAGVGWGGGDFFCQGFPPMGRGGGGGSLSISSLLGPPLRPKHSPHLPMLINLNFSGLHRHSPV